MTLTYYVLHENGVIHRHRAIGVRSVNEFLSTRELAGIEPVHAWPAGRPGASLDWYGEVGLVSTYRLR